jgi:hypothetical protein
MRRLGRSGVNSDATRQRRDAYDGRGGRDESAYVRPDLREQRDVSLGSPRREHIEVREIVGRAGLHLGARVAARTRTPTSGSGSLRIVSVIAPTWRYLGHIRGPKVVFMGEHMPAWYV